MPRVSYFLGECLERQVKCTVRVRDMRYSCVGLTVRDMHAVGDTFGTEGELSAKTGKYWEINKPHISEQRRLTDLVNMLPIFLISRSSLTNAGNWNLFSQNKIFELAPCVTNKWKSRVISTLRGSWTLWRLSAPSQEHKVRLEVIRLVFYCLTSHLS